MTSPLLNIITTVVSTISTAVIIGGFVVLSEMHTDVQVTKVLVQEHQNVHSLEYVEEQRTHNRVAAIEQALASQSITIDYYHGARFNDGN